MAAANKALKKRAKDFAETHGLSYLAALKAVDEPLHELRDLVQLRTILALPHFRLVGEEGLYSKAYEAPKNFSNPWIDYYGQLIESHDLTATVDTMDLIQEVARRAELIRTAGVENIWSYRELHRAGLLGSSAENLEPRFEYYGPALTDGRQIIHSKGAYLGIFGVNLADFFEVEDGFELIPVAIDQLAALREGRSSGSSLLDFQSYESRMDAVKEVGRFAVLARLKRTRPAIAPSRRQRPIIEVLFEDSDPELMERTFENLGLSSDDFTIESVEGPELLIEHCGDQKVGWVKEAYEAGHGFRDLHFGYSVQNLFIVRRES